MRSVAGRRQADSNDGWSGGWQPHNSARTGKQTPHSCVKTICPLLDKAIDWFTVIAQRTTACVHTAFLRNHHHHDGSSSSRRHLQCSISVIAPVTHTPALHVILQTPARGKYWYSIYRLISLTSNLININFTCTCFTGRTADYTDLIWASPNDTHTRVSKSHLHPTNTSTGVYNLYIMYTPWQWLLLLARVWLAFWRPNAVSVVMRGRGRWRAALENGNRWWKQRERTPRHRHTLHSTLT